ncbi:hypothetical protein EC912_102781 [Luteibacter rhizovicinus]|uniref:Tetratricopeptide repeat protein n=1 Tax=Luteibacter rhizovicinus TaxID=242606 RepID=A0A4R3YV32_9GAMM|nr:UDP-N-acetylglucosamine-peptide N-acetylglucosaminyltransferase [Luteibacter rhizovicinus]TCV96430.1 hypothetical protein EC912_102781 [Luteibacter rhizovicinus]
MEEERTSVTSARALVNQAWSSPMSYEPLWEARTLLENALKVDQDNVVVLTCLGAVLCDLHLHPEARTVLERAVRLGSTDRNTFFNLFVATIDSTTRKNARAVLDRGAHLDRNEATWEAYFDAQAR